MTDIVIQISDPHLATLIRLELERNARSVSLKPDNCILFITDSANPVSVKYSFKLGIQRNGDVFDDSFDSLIPRPVELSELRKTVARFFEIQEEIISKHLDESAPELCTFPEEKTIVWEGRRIKLTNNEFIIFSALLEANGEPVSREQLNKITDSTGNAVDVYICYLRKKLFFQGKNPIITVRGKGYACIFKYNI